MTSLSKISTPGTINHVEPDLMMITRRTWIKTAAGASLIPLISGTGHLEAKQKKFNKRKAKGGQFEPDIGKGKGAGDLVKKV